MARGGNRKGAGRPKGTPNVRASIYQYFSESDIEEFFEFLKDNYKEDMRLMQWLGDHILGKPQQHLDHTTNGKELPQPILHVLNNDSDEKGSQSQEEN